ncbi:MAG: putative bifunctional diguanylate cyclase/phosphodiesterase [Geminicoccaceae bacterium]
MKSSKAAQPSTGAPLDPGRKRSNAKPSSPHVEQSQTPANASGGSPEHELDWEPLLFANPVGVVVLDRGGRIIRWSKQAEAILGLSDDDVLFRSVLELPVFAAEQRNGLAKILNALASGAESHGQMKHDLERGDGSSVHCVWQMSAGQGTEGPVVLALLVDMTREKRAENRFRSLAHHDSLTGLPNRTLLSDRLETGLARAKRDQRSGAFGLLDLDGFKQVNDRFGHATGDRLLVDLAGRLRSQLRAEDTVARLGGDEFALVLPSVANATGAALVAEKLINAVREPFVLDGHSVHIGASIGLAMFPDDAEAISDLLQQADLALYRAKERGRSRAEFFTAELNHVVEQRHQLLTELRQALERDEFVLHFQPIVASKPRRLVAVEALLRWQHPARGLLRPPEFLDVAEHSELIGPVTSWLLRRCLGVVAKLRAGDHPDLAMVVNVSETLVRGHDLVALVTDACAELGVAPDGLRLDLPATMLVKPVDRTVTMAVHDLSRAGVSLTVGGIDQLSANIGLFDNPSIDGVKLSPALIHGVPDDPKVSSIVRGLIEIAHGHGLRIGCTAVETEAQAAAMVAWGCDEMQGYRFGEPLPIDAPTGVLDGTFPNLP